MVPHKGGIYFDTLMEGVSKKTMVWGHPGYLQPNLSTFNIYICMHYIFMWIYTYAYSTEGDQHMINILGNFYDKSQVFNILK